jgi:hypothetical protein
MGEADEPFQQGWDALVMLRARVCLEGDGQEDVYLPYDILGL